MNKVEGLTEQQAFQSEQIKAYIENYRKGHTPWRRVDVKLSDMKNLGDNAPVYRKIGRNEKCTCGSNKKVKNCCGVQTRYYLQNGKPMDLPKG